MENFLYPNNILFTIGFAIQVISILFLFIDKQKKSLYFTNSFLILGLILGLTATLSSIFSTSVNYLSMFNEFIFIDNLSRYFLFVVQLIAIPTTIFNYSYLNHYIKEKRSVKSFMLFYIILLISTQIIVIANHAVLFLVAWEVMSLSSYFAMVLEKENQEVQRGSFYYFAASHVLVFILYIMFFLLHNESGSWFFSDFHLAFNNNFNVTIIFILSLVGFGIKAGFMPFHFWLPQAHPIAPTVLSAFLSGVLIKMGIYGILRTYLFIKPVPEWTGWLVLIFSLISAIYGVWYALAQHDIKRLLAYHSVENIGIIGIGIGIGFIGSANYLPVIEVLGFGGALLHTLNHAIFKSLLFIGSGVVYQNLGTRNIELMGGIVHKAKYLTLFFLIGSVAISGIPPFNGFISEFIIYKGFFKASNELKNYYPILMLMSAVALAFVGGLAVACFTKINSIMFLGTPRTEIKNFHTSVYDYSSLGIFATLCIIIGFYPQPFVKIINNVVFNNFVLNGYSSALIEIDWFYFTIIFSSVAIGIFALYLFKLNHEKKYGRRISSAWGCGYDKLTPRMQYTASSFADEINEIQKSILVYHKNVEISKSIFPVKSKFESHSKDLVDNKFILPSFKLLTTFISKFHFISQTDIRFYIGYILIIILLYSLIALLWI